MRFGVLGPLQVVAGNCDRPVVISAPRLRALLAVLLWRAGQPVSTGELAELVWDGVPPGGAREAVRALVLRLRRQLGQQAAARIVARAPGYVIEVSAGELDASRLETLTQQAGAAVGARRWAQAGQAAAGALGLWRGAPLADVPSQLLRDQWVPHLEQLYVQALEWRIEADLHDGRAAQLIPELQDLTARHPLREHFHGQLMLALYRSGRQGEALAAYRRAREVLVADLGVEPGPGLRELHQQMLSADPALAVAGPAWGAEAGAVRVTPRELPPAVPGFTGRAAELAALTGLLDRSGAGAGGTVVISAIGGTAGVGKTALAVHWAHQVSGRFPDGQLFVNLRGYDPAGTPLEAGAVVGRFLEALAVPPERIPSDLDAQVGLYRSLLAGKQMLIVLDNARDSSQVRPLLPGAGGCLVVVTSRSRLADLVAVDGAVPVPVGPLTQAESRELLARRLGASRIAGRPEVVDELIELCARLPLALSIASARPAGSLEVLAGDLRDERRRLDMLSAGPGAGDIRAVLSWSFGALSPPAARLLCLLSLHPGPDISLTATAALAALTADDTYGTVHELLDAHLLAEHAHRRYSMHDLLRAYAAEQSAVHLSGPERDQATGRMLDHYLHTAHAAARIKNPALGPLPLPRRAVTAERFADREQVLSWCRDEQAVLAAVTTHAARDGHDAHAWQLACSTASALEFTGNWQQHLTLLQAGLRAAEHAGDPSGQAHTHHHLGRALIIGGQAGAALAHLHQAMELFGQLADALNQADTHVTLAVAFDQLGPPARSLQHAQLALRLYQDADSRPGQAVALMNISWAQALLGQHEQALTAATRALELTRQTRGPGTWQAAVEDTIGYIHHQLGDHATALRHYQQALYHNNNGGSLRLQVTILTHLSDTYHATGDHTAAETTSHQAAAILGQLQHPTPNATDSSEP